jgi:hypothetical protein
MPSSLKSHQDLQDEIIAKASIKIQTRCVGGFGASLNRKANL